MGTEEEGGYLPVSLPEGLPERQQLAAVVLPGDVGGISGWLVSPGRIDLIDVIDRINSADWAVIGVP